MQIQNEYLLVFSSHNQAAFLYGRLIRMGYNVELVSTPCGISAGCTQSIKFHERYMQNIRNEVAKKNIMIKGIYRISNDGGKRSYVRVI